MHSDLSIYANFDFSDIDAEGIEGVGLHPDYIETTFIQATRAPSCKGMKT
jgi:hypothetical protein